MAEHLKLINDEKPQSEWGSLVMTHTSKEILRSLHHIAGQPGSITMIAAVPGAGKSETLREYQRSAYDTTLVQITSGEGRIRDIIDVLCAALKIDKPQSATVSEQRKYIGKVIGECSTVIFDEAQYLVNKDPRSAINFETLEWLRGMAEDSSFSLCFAGDLALSKHIAKCPQLRRRIKRPVIVKSILKDDVAAIAAHHGVNDPDAIAALYRVSNSFGGLGDVVAAIKHAQLFSGDKNVSNSHLLAAIEDLKLNAKGAW